MPFTDSPSKLAPVPSRTERAITAVLADAGSHDQRQHLNRALKIACPACPAMITSGATPSRTRPAVPAATPPGRTPNA